MRNGKPARELAGTVEAGTKALTPASLAFVLAVTGGLVDRYRRLRKERDHGAVSIETAIIVAVLIAAAIAISVAIIAMYKKYRDGLNTSDDKYTPPAEGN
ncbi:hypothetical protein [Embleya sp. NBC_00896]|uniref:hypothetical protein n=1 Tax=Embleya sp. NBC_00896 TaxID=2975961 RepID=UPI0038634951|nr:hypothetical protein OG928_07610 [Embleya sp. NBC_00896]